MWVLIIIGIVLLAIGYMWGVAVGGAFLAKERDAIIERMAEHKVVELMAREVTEELRKRIATKAAQKALQVTAPHLPRGDN
jgi:hypothetical protein